MCIFYSLGVNIFVLTKITKALSILFLSLRSLGIAMLLSNDKCTLFRESLRAVPLLRTYSLIKYD